MHLGDCLEVLPTLTVSKYDLVVTDPPYGIDCTKTGADPRVGGMVQPSATNDRFTKRGGSIIAGDKAPDGRFLTDLVRLMRPASVLYLFSRWDVDRHWQGFIEDVGLAPKNRIAWVKSNFGSGDLTGAFGFQYESLWRASKGRARLRVPRTGDVWTDLWASCVRSGKNHPFEKPVDLLSKAIVSDSDLGDFALDPFAGSASTGVAALRTGRRFVGIELDPHWFSVACERLRAEEQGSTLKAQRAGQVALFGGVKP
jgi:site-specific DNA-methyltransferase (adenine-specific)